MKKLDAVAVVGAVLVTAVEQYSAFVEGLVVDCADHDAYTALPKVVNYAGQLYGLTGWNSDLCRAYYKNDARIAFAQRTSAEVL